MMPVDSPHTQDGEFEGDIPVRIPLALLLTLKDLDTPEDPSELEGGDLSLNLRRRLGLSSVVLKQIHRYQAEGGDVSATEVGSLFDLVAKRVDSPEIFGVTGHRIAREELGARGVVVMRGGWRLMPLAWRRLRAWRKARQIARLLCPASGIRVSKGTLVIERGLPALATAEKGGAGCALLTGIIDALFEAYRVGDGHAVHTHCEAGTDDRCAWAFAVEPDPDSGPDDETDDAADD